MSRSQSKKTWFTADLHLGHLGILKMCDRPFDIIDEMDECILHEINTCVRRDDILYILGDFCWGARKVGHYRQRIECREVHLIQGNHDRNSAATHFSTCNRLLEISPYGQRITLCHCPFVTWPGEAMGAWNLYGHCHSNREEMLNSIWPKRKATDVGVDHALQCLGMLKPFSFDILKEVFDARSAA